MRGKILLLVLAVFTSSASARDRILDSATFVDSVSGRTLALGLFGVRLKIYEDGRIEGRGLGRPVTGFWRWQEGYFCRTLIWGTRDLGPNCQEVVLDAGKIEFTSDRGTGPSASFSLK
jgi:hypothetical protein